MTIMMIVIIQKRIRNPWAALQSDHRRLLANPHNDVLFLHSAPETSHKSNKHPVGIRGASPYRTIPHFFPEAKLKPTSQAIGIRMHRKIESRRGKNLTLQLPAPSHLAPNIRLPTDSRLLCNVTLTSSRGLHWHGLHGPFAWAIAFARKVPYRYYGSTMAKHRNFL